MKIRRIRATDIWLLSKGNKILYRGKQSPWQSPEVIATALRRDGLPLVALPIQKRVAPCR